MPSRFELFERFDLRSLTLLLVVPLVALACQGPLGPLSGGRLGGPVVEDARTDWAFTAAVENAQIETGPDNPHSVNIWCGHVDGALYVPSSMISGPTDPSEREWIRNVQADPRVRIRLDGNVYKRVVVRLADGPEYDAARTALETKYRLDPAERDPERAVWIFRLDPR
jgi:hypothetical protein